MRRVVITGMGVVSPHGVGTNAHWAGLVEGKSSVGPLTRFDPASFPSRVAGQIPAFKTADFVPKSYRKATRLMARDIEIAVVAADLAVRDAKLATRGVLESQGEKILSEGYFKPDPTRLGCNIGAGLICADLDELTAAMVQARNEDGSFSLAKWGKSEDPAKTSGMDNLTPLWLLKYLPNMLACHVSIIHDTQGPSNTITCGQASAGLALSEACRTIQRGNADMALVGGGESKVHPMGLMRWSLLNRLNTRDNDKPAEACRPLDQDAAGTVLGEAAGVLVIEELEHAKKRGATIYAEIIGLGASSNAVAVTEPDITGEAQAAAMKKSLKNAGVSPEAINMIVPPGYGASNWDQADAAAIQAVFGQNGTVVPLRGGIGDCGAGSQAIDLVGAAMALYTQTLPPAVNCPNPINGLKVSQAKTETKLDYAVVVGGSLGGQNSSVVLKKYQTS